jgi:probable HAF family extracellular repeat protein
MKLKLFFIILVSLISFASMAHADGFLYAEGKFTPINSLADAWASGINNSGDIVGSYSDASGNHQHGFLYTGGIFTTIDVPGAPYTEAYGINDSGSIVGFYLDAERYHGFLDAGGIFTTIDVPFADTYATMAFGINDSGDIVGMSQSPEPTTMLLLGSGLLGLAAYGRKRFFKK